MIRDLELAYQYNKGLPLEISVLEFAQEHGLAPWVVAQEEPTTEIIWKWFEIALAYRNKIRTPQPNGK